MKTKAFLLIFIALTGCTRNVSPSNDYRVKVIGENKSKSTCISLGGTPRSIAMLASVCMFPAKDAGISCTDDSHCEGICEPPDSAYKKVYGKKILRISSPEPGTPMTGYCSTETSRSGKIVNCRDHIVDGKVAEHICWD